jgi:hypothetical protein
MAGYATIILGIHEQFPGCNYVVNCGRVWRACAGGPELGPGADWTGNYTSTRCTKNITPFRNTPAQRKQSIITVHALHRTSRTATYTLINIRRLPSPDHWSLYDVGLLTILVAVSTDNH